MELVDDYKEIRISKMIKLFMQGEYAHLIVKDDDTVKTLEIINEVLDSPYNNLEQVLDTIEIYLEENNIEYSWVSSTVELIELDSPIEIYDQDDLGRA